MKQRPNKSKAGRKPERKAPPGKTVAGGLAAPMPAGRKWLFRFIALVIVPLLLLGGLEAALRLAGYGYSTGFFKKIRVGGKDYLVNNENFSLRFFPPQLARWPDPFVFPATKPPDTVRIFIFGESAAMGDPQLARRVVQFFAKPAPDASSIARLTPGEKEFLDQLANGYAYKEIADRMKISIDTVRSYVRTVYEKLHVHSRTEAVVKYLRGCPHKHAVDTSSIQR